MTASTPSDFDEFGVRVTNEETLTVPQADEDSALDAAGAALDQQLELDNTSPPLSPCLTEPWFVMFKGEPSAWQSGTLIAPNEDGMVELDPESVITVGFTARCRRIIFGGTGSGDAMSLEVASTR